MIEQILEKKIADEFSTALSGMNIQVIGAWQPMPDDEVKSLEDRNASGYLTVRMQPRNYDTPTIPTAQFPCTITLVVRAEVDSDGQGYLAVTNAVTNVLQRWQSSIEAVSETFSISEKLNVVGFQLTGGDVGSDKQNKIWTYTQSLIVYGVVLM